MLEQLKEKRAECVEDIAFCEKELERAKIKLELIDELISDATEEEEAAEEETTEETGEVEITHTGYIE